MQLIWISGPSGRMRSWTLQRGHVFLALALAVSLPMVGTLGNLAWRWYSGQEQVAVQAQQQELLHDINSRLAQMVVQVQLLEQQKSDMLSLLGARVKPEEAPAGKGSLRFQGGPLKLLMRVGVRRTLGRKQKANSMHTRPGCVVSINSGNTNKRSCSPCLCHFL